MYEYVISDDDNTQFIRNHILDILAMIPYNYIFLRFFAFYRIFRILQIFNIFKIWSVRDNYRGTFKYFVHNRLLKVITLLLICYLILASVILKEVDPSFTSVFNSFWFNVVTMTSVGYGDITPITITGKVIGIITIIIGCAFLSVFTAAMSSIYMEKNEEETRREFDVKFKETNERIDGLTDKVSRLEKDIDVLTDKIDILIDKMNDEEE
ncbi:MAG: ion channel [Methanosphaera sp.]|nr:ion channel [Methanosphaera sp.]